MFIEHIKRNKTVYTLMLLSIIGYLSKYALNILLSHHLSPRRFGEFNISMRILGILTSLALLGTNVSAKRFVSRFIKINDSANLQLFIQWNMRLIRYTFFLCIFVGIFAYLIMHMMHIWHIKNIQDYHMTLYMLWVAPVAALFALLDSYLLCIEYTLFSNFLNNIKTAFYILVFFVFFIFFKTEIHVFMLSLVLFVALLLLLLVEVGFIVQKSPILAQHMLDAIRANTTPPVHENWLTVSVRMAVNNLMFLLVCTGDLFIVQIFCPNEAAVAQYAVVLTVSSAIFVIPQNLYAAVKGRISHLVETAEGRKTIEHEIKILNRYSLGVILTIGSIIFCFGHQLLGYFGPVYAEAHFPLVIVTIGFMIGGFAQGGIMLVAYSGNEKIATNASLIELGTLILFGSVLTLLYGINGTAFATSIAIITKTVIFHVQSYRKLGIHSFAL